VFIEEVSLKEGQVVVLKEGKQAICLPVTLFLVDAFLRVTKEHTK
jgi:hypothetical protein